MITGVTALLVSGALAGAPGGVGETMDWKVHYLGMHVGNARVEVADGGGEAWVIRGRSWSAPWYSRVYSVDDHTTSFWTPGVGSSRYQTVFREGGFHQDQDMRIAPDGIHVDRRQLFKEEGWRSWEDDYEGPGYPMEDPVTAFYHLRGLALPDGGSTTIPLFSGKRVTQVQISVEGREPLDTAIGEVDTIRVRISSQRDDELKGKGRIWVWITDDETRLPVKVLWKSNSIGSVHAELTGWTPAPPKSGPPTDAGDGDAEAR